MFFLVYISMFEIRNGSHSIYCCRFGQALLFDSVVEFIRKESGSAIQKHAVRLLFLILNCKVQYFQFISPKDTLNYLIDFTFCEKL